MHRSELKKIGLVDVQIEKVMASHGKSINATKKVLDLVTTERNNLIDKIKQLKKQVNQL